MRSSCCSIPKLSASNCYLLAAADIDWRVKMPKKTPKKAPNEQEVNDVNDEQDQGTLMRVM
eukprot:8428340-Ditylum_brightwellii.AAC.1